MLFDKRPSLFGSRSNISRRSFLRGLGAGALALPFLPSLSTSATAAQDAKYARVMLIAWEHGVAPKLWKPTFQGPMQQLAPGVMGRDLQDADFGLYMGSHFDGLRSKFSMLAGISQIGAWGHSPAMALAASERHSKDSGIAPIYPDSLDVVLADSGKIYDVPPRMDVLRLGRKGNGLSYRAGSQLRSIDNSVAFERLFGDGFPSPDTLPTTQNPAKMRLRRQRRVVEQTLKGYRRLERSGRLSSEDLVALRQSMQHYHELSQSLLAQIESTQDADLDACASFDVLGSDDTTQRYTDEINLFTQAFACNMTRIGVWKLGSTHVDGDGAHNAYNATNREGTGAYSTKMKENCFWIAQLMNKMDSIVEGNGKTMLDNSLILVTSDMATSIIGTHPGVDAPFLVAGGLGGALRMGQYLEYFDRVHGDLRTRRSNLGNVATAKGLDPFGGPPSNELFISLMQSLGLDKSDWERGGKEGFGTYQCDGFPAICEGTKHTDIQSYYVDYYNEVYRHTKPPGSGLDYFTV